MLDIYSQIVFNRTADEVTKFEERENKPAFTPSWILKITWDHVMPVSYQKINLSEVKRLIIMFNFEIDALKRDCILLSLFLFFSFSELKLLPNCESVAANVISVVLSC